MTARFFGLLVLALVFTGIPIFADGPSAILRIRASAQFAGTCTASTLGVSASAAVDNWFSVGAEGLFPDRRQH